MNTLSFFNLNRRREGSWNILFDFEVWANIWPVFNFFPTVPKYCSLFKAPRRYTFINPVALALLQLVYNKECLSPSLLLTPPHKKKIACELRLLGNSPFLILRTLTFRFQLELDILNWGIWRKSILFLDPKRQFWPFKGRW